MRLLKLIIIILFSFGSLAMDLKGLEEYRRKTLADLAKLQESTRGFQNHWARYSSFANPAGHSRKVGAYTHFLELPKELKGKALVHALCNCNDLVKDGHYCGSHALTHALEDRATYLDNALQDKASTIVKR